LKDIPVMHFFSGAHQDYHKPSDDVDKINYEGIQQIGRIIITSIQSLEKEGKLVFSKTSNEDNTNVPRFKVTLGVVPDYMFDGAGMRIDGVTDGRPASKAGLEVGDVVIQLGEYKVSDMMSYMRALSMFNKTDKTTVKIQRGEEVLDREITF